MPQFKLFDVFSNANVTLSIGIIGISAVFIIIVLIFVFVGKKRNFSNNFSCHDQLFPIPESNQTFKKLDLTNNESVNGNLQPSDKNTLFTSETCSNHVNINVNDIINHDRTLHTFADRSKTFVVRNRGSCASSSDSTTTSGSFEEETATFLRHRDSTKCPPTRMLQQMLQQQQMQPALMSLPENQDCVVVMQQDQFSDNQNVFDDPVSGIVGRCGLLEVAFAYDAPVRKMTIHLLQAKDIPVKDHGKPSCTQIHVVLLPGKKQKQKSKVRSGDNPQYIETFLFSRIAPEEVNNLSIRFRLYSYERMRRQRLIGECIVSFANINLQLHTNIWIPLEPKANTILNAQACEVLSLSQSDSTGSILSMQHGGVPELFLGLSYNGTTGRLFVEVIKGSHFRHVTASRAPDTYVKILLLNNTGQELARTKTSVRRSQTNPLFKELFMFQVTLFQLCDITLLLVVYTKKTIKKKERLGWFSMGKTNTSEEELSHWKDIKYGRGDQICRWHILIET